MSETDHQIDRRPIAPAAPLSRDSLRILLVEDQRQDAELIAAALRSVGYALDLTRVEREAEYSAALDLEPDIVLCDFVMPEFTAERALQLLQARELDTPFIIVSGQIGEERAVHAMRLGVDDYLLKDRLMRLGPAVESALQRRDMRRQARRAAREREEAEERFRITFEQAGIGIVHTALDSRYLLVNEKFCEMTGYTRDELLSMRSTDIMHPSESRRPLQHAMLLDGTLQTYSGERRYVRKDGEIICVNRTVTVIRDAVGEPLYALRLIEDITERKRAEQRAALLQATTLAISQAESLDSALQMVLQKICESTGWSYGEAWLPDASGAWLESRAAWHHGSAELGEFSRRRPRLELQAGHGLAVPAFLQRRPRCLHGLVEADFHYPDSAAAAGFKSWVGIPVVADEKAVALLGFFIEADREPDAGLVELVDVVATQLALVFQRKATEELLRESERNLLQLANYDQLTELPNRVLFYDRLTQTLAHSCRNGWSSAVLIIDLDRFRSVNETLGHDRADMLLKEVAARLRRCVRSADTVARLTSDEFAVVLSELAAPQDAGLVAQGILKALNDPFDIEGGEAYATASLGVAIYPADAEDIDTLIRDADAAMHSAKAAGRNTYRFYTREMNECTIDKMQLEAKLRRALERDEFLLHYQPKVNIATGTIAGFEALLRWQAPEGALVSPGEFIPLLEETGLIVQVGEWALRAACAQMRSWREMRLRQVPVAVNLSSRQFHQQDLCALVRKTLREHGISPHLLELEITESAAMHHPETSIVMLRELRALGVHLAIDDFGTGYSSLSYLKRLPIETVKIDRSFITDLATDPDDASIAQAIIKMAHTLNLKVVAEGVETASQLSFLSAHGCDEMQGYYFSKPVPAAEATAMLKQDRELQRPEAQLNNGQRTVLLLDDEENVLSALQRLLRRDGYQIFTATSVPAAFEILANHKVGVIVSDQRMPGVTGVEFLRRVKELYPDSVRMVLSGYTDLDSVTEAINQGAIYKFLTKPWDDNLLRAHITEAFRHYQAMNDLTSAQRAADTKIDELSRANFKLQMLIADHNGRDTVSTAAEHAPRREWTPS